MRRPGRHFDIEYSRIETPTSSHQVKRNVELMVTGRKAVFHVIRLDFAFAPPWLSCSHAWHPAHQNATASAFGL
jgi:hypothetical protein